MKLVLGDYMKLVVRWNFLVLEMVIILAAWQDCTSLPRVSKKGLVEGIGQSTPGGSNKAKSNEDVSFGKRGIQGL